MKKLLALLFSALLIGSAQADIRTLNNLNTLDLDGEISAGGTFAGFLGFKLGEGNGMLGLASSDSPLSSFSTWLSYSDGSGHLNPTWSSLTASSDGSGFDMAQFLYAGLLAGNTAYTLHVSAAGAPGTQFSMFITSVPEPESWALFLAGLGIMGAIARRRSAPHAA
jgi:hypothetical protein